MFLIILHLVTNVLIKKSGNVRSFLLGVLCVMSILEDLDDNSYE